jgi:hypothetical protein
MPQFRPAAAVEFWRVTLNPPPNCDVVAAQVALGHHFFQIPKTQAEAKVPSDTQNDDLSFKMTSLEQRWPFPPHVDRSLSECLQPVCNTSLQKYRYSTQRFAEPCDRQQQLASIPAFVLTNTKQSNRAVQPDQFDDVGLKKWRA